jgi:polar amino acid transport system substrate-binding protein
MNRRKFLTLVPAGFLVACEREAGPRPLVVGMDMTYPPFEFKNEKGEPDGVDVRIAEALAKYLGRELKLEAYPFEGLLAAVPAGKVDLAISAMTATDERRKSFDFSDPYVFTALAMLVPRDSSVKSAADLNKPGVKITAKLGTTGESYARENLTLAGEPIVFEDEVQCVKEVAMKLADAFIYDQLSIYGHWEKNKDTTRPILTPIREEAWAIGIRKGNDELRLKVNAFLKEFRESGGLAKLADQYLVKERKLLEDMGAPFIFR